MFPHAHAPGKAQNAAHWTFETLSSRFDFHPDPVTGATGLAEVIVRVPASGAMDATVELMDDTGHLLATLHRVTAIQGPSFREDGRSEIEARHDAACRPAEPDHPGLDATDESDTEN